VDRVSASCPVLRIEVLQLAFDLIEDLRVEQVAELDSTQQLAELRLVDGQSLGAPFGERCVAVVQVVGHVSKSTERQCDGVREST